MGLPEATFERPDPASLRLTLDNPVAPVPDAGPRPDGNHMAQANVRERLAAFFGPGARMDVESDAGRYRVTLRFPYRSEP